MPYDGINRDGFTCAFGQFYAKGRVARIDGPRLKTMFLPRLTPEAKRLLRDHHGSGFVRGQLQHYGVDYDEEELSGNGTLLLKKVLKAGKCDKVPAHIEELRSQMHTEWLEKLSEEKLSDHPELIMEKYFVDSSGKPDPTKTSKVVGIPYPRSSDYRTGQLREIASRVGGLYHATGWGSTQTIYLGWDQDDVRIASRNHAAQEARADKAKADAREEERASKHRRYLANAEKHNRGASTPSPVGQYIIDCDKIEKGWPEEAGDMTLGIHATPTLGVYQATFDFGVIKGIMMMSCDESILDQFCAQQEHDEDSDSGGDSDIYNYSEICNYSGIYDYSDSEDYYEEDGRDGRADCGIQKEGHDQQGQDPQRTTSQESETKYFIRLKSRDSATGEIHPEAEKGTISFSGQDLSSFIGKTSVACVGRGVIFKARKISAVPSNSCDSWDNYSQAAYEYARVARWR